MLNKLKAVAYPSSQCHRYLGSYLRNLLDFGLWSLVDVDLDNEFLIYFVCNILSFLIFK